VLAGHGLGQRDARHGAREHGAQRNNSADDETAMDAHADTSEKTTIRPLYRPTSPIPYDPDHVFPIFPGGVAGPKLGCRFATACGDRFRLREVRRFSPPRPAAR
jgi:hypothetical protein